MPSPTNVNADLPYRPRAAKWPKLVVGVIAATVLPIGIHELMLSGLGVPYPRTDGVPAWILNANAILSCLALLWAVQRTSDAFNRRPLWVQCLCVSLAASAILETFRGVFMNGFVTTAYLYNFLIALPFIVSRFALFSGVTVIARSPTRNPVKVVSVVLLAAFLIWFEPWFEQILAFDTRFAILSHPEVYAPPYGWVVNVPSTLTFIEPVLGLLAAYRVMRSKLAPMRVHRLAVFTVFALLLRKPLFSALIYGIWSPMGYFGFMGAESQFVLEWIAVATLVGVTVEWGGRSPRTGG